MTTSTMHLPKKSIDWLQSLIQVNIDSRDGFNEAAENLQKTAPEVGSLFRELAGERSQQAMDLQDIVSQNAETPQESGSVSAAAHRTWMDLRTALGGGAHAVLSEAERGEDHIKAKYEEALKDLGTCPCTTLLREQYDNVQSSHDRVKSLRDRCNK